LLLVLAVFGPVGAACLARPVLRSPWFFLLFVIHPCFIDVLYSFQFATAWSLLFFFLFIWAFERRRFAVAGLLLWLTVSSHPIMGTFAVGCYAVGLLVKRQPNIRTLALISLP